MIYNMKNVFRIAVIVCASAWLSSCSTYVNPFSSLYWKGKNIKEFIEDKELAVNETKICKKKIKHFLSIVLQNLCIKFLIEKLADLIMLLVQLFTLKEKMFLLVIIGLMPLQT